jgi:hypothetical protein
MEIYPKNELGGEGYYVYDEITLEDKQLGPVIEKRYNIARLENKADNPFIRFKIVGGWNEGLSIRFSRFDNDAKICEFKIMTYFSEEKYTNAGLAWSSSLYKMTIKQKPNHKDKFC